MDLVVFAGVAGGADSSLEIGDVVIGTKLLQHDLDPRPLFRRFEVPLLEKVVFEVPPHIVALARESATLYLHAAIFAKRTPLSGAAPNPALERGADPAPVIVRD